MQNFVEQAKRKERAILIAPSLLPQGAMGMEAENAIDFAQRFHRKGFAYWLLSWKGELIAHLDPQEVEELEVRVDPLHSTPEIKQALKGSKWAYCGWDLSEEEVSNLLLYLQEKPRPMRSDYVVDLAARLIPIGVTITVTSRT